MTGIKRATKDANMTSFHGHVIEATPEKLFNLLGPPTYESNDGRDKVNMEWVMELECGSIFTIYDWKEYKKLSMTHKILWHIGSGGPEVARWAKIEMENIL